MRILEPHTVTVLMTDKCTAACRHCCMNSSPERSHHLTYEQIESALRACFDNYNIRVVVFAGGEPTLLGDVLLKSLRFCKLNGVVSRIITNAYWAHSPEAALAKCTQLREAGLNELNISMDDYHEPYIALERVKFAYDAAMQLDFSGIVIANCVGPHSSFTPQVLEQAFGMGGVEMQRRFDVNGVSRNFERSEGGKFIILSNANVQRIGRGTDLVDDEECPGEIDIMDPPPGMTLGGCPWAVRSVAISPRNHLVACCGFELHGNPILDFGSLDEHAMDDLIDKADNDLIVNAISLIGPPQMIQLLKRICPDEIYFPRKLYRSFCEACQDLIGIEKNRRALYKYQGMFAEVVIQAREELDRSFRDASGRIDIQPFRLGDVHLVDKESSPI